MENSNLEYITENDFLGLTQLTNIFLGSNKLKELPCGVFDTNKRLQQLHFEDNHLNKIGADIFKPLPLLSLAHFRSNECINKDVETIGGIPGLLNEIAKKCSIGCEKSSAYPPLSSKDKCENIEEKLNNFENTVNNITALNHNITKDLDASKIENLKINKEKDELNNNIKKLESKLTQSMKDTKQNEEKCNIIISNKDKNIIENKKEIKTLENTVHGLKKDLDASKVEIFKINKERDALNLNFEEMKTKNNKIIEDAKQNEIKFRETTVSKDNKIAGLESNIQNIIETLGIAEKNWTIRCSKDDYNNCYTKNYSTAVESYDYTNLKSFYEFKTDSEFRIENSKMTNMSNSFFKHFPFIKYIFVTASMLKTIKCGNFIDAVHLLQITITRNHIRYLEDSAFQGATNVELINLAMNRIESLSDKAFNGLRKLKELNLSNNQIKLLKQDFFANLPSLEVLHMEGNALTVLSGRLFRNNPRLSRAYFNRNNLKYISPQIFLNLKKLVYINLLDNSCINKEYKELKNSKMMIRDIQQMCEKVVKSRYVL